MWRTMHGSDDSGTATAELNKITEVGMSYCRTMKPFKVLGYVAPLVSSNRALPPRSRALQ